MGYRPDIYRLSPAARNFPSTAAVSNFYEVSKTKIKIQMAKTISMKKMAKAISVAYRVSDNEAQELVPMFMILKAA